MFCLYSSWYWLWTANKGNVILYLRSQLMKGSECIRKGTSVEAADSDSHGTHVFVTREAVVGQHRITSLRTARSRPMHRPTRCLAGFHTSRILWRYSFSCIISSNYVAHFVVLMPESCNEGSNAPSIRSAAAD